MRGARGQAFGPALCGGIIPADAGSTPDQGCPCPLWSGSSPRMRGARTPSLVDMCSPRIIPADAGSTNPTAYTPYGVKDHPRGCGEHTTLRSTLPGQPGSSPRMRGAQSKVRSAHIVMRIIPADAGSTEYGHLQCPQWQDHPRGCGEHFRLVFTPGPVAGSSPRMRGAQTLVIVIINAARIIPADAGSTSASIRS